MNVKQLFKNNRACILSWLVKEHEGMSPALNGLGGMWPHITSYDCMYMQLKVLRLINRNPYVQKHVATWPSHLYKHTGHPIPKPALTVPIQSKEFMHCCLRSKRPGSQSTFQFIPKVINWMRSQLGADHPSSSVPNSPKARQVHSRVSIKQKTL